MPLDTERGGVAPETLSGDASSEAFLIRDCALIALATGRKAQSLKGLRDHIAAVHPGCIYYHFWGARLEHRFEEREYNNDFAAWAYRSLHDATLAERLSVIDPTEFQDMDLLRQELVDVIEERMDETEVVAWSRRDEQFEFIRSQIVVFDTLQRLTRPEELAELVPHLSTGSIFYHFIDARRRGDNPMDDFRGWLSAFGDTYAALQTMLSEIDPYFVTLIELRHILSRTVQQYFAPAA